MEIKLTDTAIMYSSSYSFQQLWFYKCHIVYTYQYNIHFLNIKYRSIYRLILYINIKIVPQVLVCNEIGS